MLQQMQYDLNELMRRNQASPADLLRVIRLDLENRAEKELLAAWTPERDAFWLNLLADLELMQPKVNSVYVPQ